MAKAQVRVRHSLEANGHQRYSTGARLSRCHFHLPDKNQNLRECDKNDEQGVIDGLAQQRLRVECGKHQVQVCFADIRRERSAHFDQLLLGITRRRGNLLRFAHPRQRVGEPRRLNDVVKVALSDLHNGSEWTVCCDATLTGGTGARRAVAFPVVRQRCHEGLHKLVFREVARSRRHSLLRRVARRKMQRVVRAVEARERVIVAQNITDKDECPRLPLVHAHDAHGNIARRAVGTIAHEDLAEDVVDLYAEVALVVFGGE
mmetsp:Transcript_44410/g.109021  ORF Transcript_44410/g.109021 Transcript_44410/m.109021 type:complete len:260 (-) Transcript_44410:610-1389(-)